MKLVGVSHGFFQFDIFIYFFTGYTGYLLYCPEAVTEPVHPDQRSVLLRMGRTNLCICTDRIDNDRLFCRSGHL